MNRCFKCGVPLKPHHRFCAYCGAPVPGPAGSGGGWKLALLAVLLVAAGVAAFFRFGPELVQKSPPAPVEQAASAVPAPEPRPEREIHAQAVARPPLSVGTARISDITGAELSRVSAAVTQNGWVALPKNACLGGKVWRFEGEAGTAVPIVEGTYHDRDEIALWQVGTRSETASGPALAAWREDAPLAWASLDTGLEVEHAPMNDCAGQGWFTRCQPPPGVEGPGVFRQDGRIVGFTFSRFPDAAFLWNGLPGDSLRADVRVDDFYRLTFSGSREEEILKALGDPSAPDFERLSALAFAFYKPSVAAAGNGPEKLHPDRVLDRIYALAHQLRDDGREDRLADLFDGGLLSAIADPDLAIFIIDTVEQARGTGRALDLMAAFRDAGAPDDARIDTFHYALNARHLDHLADAGDDAAFRKALFEAEQRFGDHPDIRLAKAELAVRDGDWRTAGGLLYDQPFPSRLQDRARNLIREIEGLKSRETAIVIRFPPGSHNIRTNARLNSLVSQAFIVDTGATTITIPTAAARALGIRYEEGLRKRVRTAGGTVDTWEISLTSVEIGGHPVYNLTALVLDIPDYPDTGLLGMNYLNRFRMDMNNNAGMLVLEPR